ncbi:MAG: FAD-dependent monooxygenase [Phycisphaeraceae bacterium]|nr:FAD-dependent monooxygenase [Phycisphaeraceae bacterium]
MPDRILIVGAGLAGSLLAVYLARAGHEVHIYERRPDPRAKGYVGGRSINLALSVRGLWGLAGVGLDTHVMRQDALPMRGRMIHPPAGTPVLQPYSKNPADAINSVSRGGLNLSLIHQAAALPNVHFHFDHACVDVDPEAPAAIVQTPDGAIRTVEADLILGADGAFSPVRARLQKTDRFEFSQTYLEHGYKELHIPPAAVVPPGQAPTPDAFAMDMAALHIWPRGSSMMIALPNRDGSFTCTLFWPFEGAHSFELLEGPLHARSTRPEPADRRCVNEFFRANYPDAFPLMPSLADDFFANPTSSLVTVRCWPWVWKGNLAILGDAAHAIVPFYGQGMNAAFEDVRVLAECLAHASRDRKAALDEFQRRRKPHADAIAEMAIENFVEMRDKVGHEDFRYKKRVEQAVHAMFEDRFTPQYNLVSFSTVPYAQARRLGIEFDRLLDRVIARVPRELAATMDEPAWKAALRVRMETLLAGDTDDGPLAVDCSPLLVPRNAGSVDPPPTAVFPGDTPLTREVLCDMAEGAHITVSTLRSTVHLGSHADGANHYAHPAPSIDQMPLSRYLGPCQVIRVTRSPGTLVLPSDMSVPITRPRILLRTDSAPDPSHFNPDFVALDPELIEMLAARGVCTIGVDTPSVDPAESKTLPAHAACARAGIAILEGLVLTHIDPGEYELISLPLRLRGFDASPVRAVLRPLTGTGG